MPSQKVIQQYLKPAVFLLCLIPAMPAIHSLAALIASKFSGVLSELIVNSVGVWPFAQTPDPIAKLLHSQGEWALRFLVIALAVTPLRFILGQPWLLNFRRMLGLYSFTYVLLHFLIWLSLDQGFYWAGIGADIAKRPFITIGFAALLLLIPLAVTSTNKMMRRLGKRWHKLHKLVYVIVPLGVWHYYWLVKKDVTEPLLYAAITAFLLGYRYWRSRKHKQVLGAN
jgi:sulfoxide reductase heme-binding subunit YedZ